ncbi:MAG: hypothetical protein O6837_11270 [Deltaproteobacteria bacterium]|nr:hypothetical protein [Deltaproteobacteria bacterium]
MKQRIKLPLQIAGFALAFLLAGQVMAASLLGEGFEKFFKERVRFGGFVENVSGLNIAHDRRDFNASNRFIMNRLTFQPEFNIDLPTSYAKLFISWRFVAEPRYSSETRSRRDTVSPAGSGGSLPADTWSEFKGVPWEAILDLFPTDKLHVRLGRQFISWGETDGLRLLDVINPRDNTMFIPASPNVFTLDETRIPQWGLRVFYTIRPVSNTIFEFFANPGFDPKKKRLDENVGTNDSGDGKADGDIRFSRWSAQPETRIAFGRLFANPIGPVPIVIPRTARRYPDAGDNWKIGARFTHNFGALNFGLGYIWGFNPQGLDQVFKVKSISCLVPVPGCPAPTVVTLDLINDRTSIFAGHFNYPLGTYGGIPVKTALRGEVAFYPSKPYNISKYPGSTGLKAGPHPRHPDGITEKNTLRYSLGFDRTTFIPVLHPDDPWRAFRMSFQIFQNVILNHEDGIRNFFTAGKIKKVQTALTFRVSTGYLGDTIIPDIFLLYEPLGSWVINPAVSYAPPWNERIKVTLTTAIYEGNRFRGITGFRDGKNTILLKLRYQL